MTTLTPFWIDLCEWIARHRLIASSAAAIFGHDATTVRRWINGRKCGHEAGIRAIMAAYDSGWRP